MTIELPDTVRDSLDTLAKGWAITPAEVVARLVAGAVRHAAFRGLSASLNARLTPAQWDQWRDDVTAERHASSSARFNRMEDAVAGRRP